MLQDTTSLTDPAAISRLLAAWLGGGQVLLATTMLPFGKFVAQFNPRNVMLGGYAACGLAYAALYLGAIVDEELWPSTVFGPATSISMISMQAVAVGLWPFCSMQVLPNPPDFGRDMAGLSFLSQMGTSALVAATGPAMDFLLGGTIDREGGRDRYPESTYALIVTAWFSSCFASSVLVVLASSAVHMRRVSSTGELL